MRAQPAEPDDIEGSTAVLAAVGDHANGWPIRLGARGQRLVQNRSGFVSITRHAVIMRVGAVVGGRDTPAR